MIFFKNGKVDDSPKVENKQKEEFSPFQFQKNRTKKTIQPMFVK